MIFWIIMAATLQYTAIHFFVRAAQRRIFLYPDWATRLLYGGFCELGALTCFAIYMQK